MSARFRDLLECEIELDEEEELLFRQIAAHMWDAQGGKPLAHAFGPSDADKGKPSFSRGSLTTADDSRAWHNANAKSTSLAVWAVTVDDVLAEGRRTVDDSACSTGAAPAHCYVDYRDMQKFDERLIRGLLLARALQHGPQHSQD